MMLSLPDDWNYTTRGLAKICKEGVDAIGNALRELETAGYIVRHHLRDRQGRISDTEYVIGYPIWWGIAAWPVSSFVEANDFTGKTVIPFCTSSSSGLGESGDLLEELAGTGAWLEGQRFRSSVSEADVADWVNGLAL